MQSFWILPLSIYLGKILELSLNSIRIVSIAKGFKYLAIIIAFIESIIWIIIVTRIIGDIDNFLNILAFGLGQATGVYVGIFIEEKLALGLVLVRVITQKTADELLRKLRKADFRVTDVDAMSNHGKVKILFSTIKRKNLQDFTKLVKQFNPTAFFTVEEVRIASQVIKKSSRKNIENILAQFNFSKEVDVPLPTQEKKETPTRKKNTLKKTAQSPKRNGKSKKT